ncbi:MAG: hypothetical protein JW913_07535 [Chitinispirillaceae bacterium]|nr:hypothetical protein [Chitinispirillaceae bacterium]
MMVSPSGVPAARAKVNASSSGSVQLSARASSSGSAGAIAIDTVLFFH